MAVNNLIPRPLTPRQKVVLDFIKEYLNRKGYSPSLDEIASHLGISIPSVHQHVELIQKKGYLKKDESQSRSMAPLQESATTFLVPLLGKISAGQPIEAYEEPEPILVPANMIKNATDYYALIVCGDSMIEDDVWDDDIILVKYQQTAEPGEMIVAVTENNVTLKRYGGVENGMIKLIPRNPRMQPFFVEPDTFEIRGKFAGLLRRHIQ
jgi:repressor LexA